VTLISLSLSLSLSIHVARDADDRQKWLVNLEEAISLNSVNTVS
jgi:hypothetical protein